MGGEAEVYSQVGVGKERTVGQIVTGMSWGSAVVHGWKAGYLWRRRRGEFGEVDKEPASPSLGGSLLYFPLSLP